jgi:peptidoglycan/LPS O-acetylase OafA/YrhL
MKRILPALFVFLIAWGFWKHSHGGFTIKDFILNFSFLGYWTLPYGKYFNWFVSGILFFYLLSPIIYLIVGKFSKNTFSAFISFLIISMLVFILRKDEDNNICRTLIMVVRLIPLLFGMFCASKTDKQATKQEKMIFASFIVLFLFGIGLYILNNLYWHDSGFTYGMPWYAFGLMTTFLSLLIVFLIEHLSKAIKFFPAILSFFGKISFEIYLTHIFIIEYIMPQLKTEGKLFLDDPWNLIFAFFTSTLFAYILSLVTKQFNFKKN